MRSYLYISTSLRQNRTNLLQNSINLVDAVNKNSVRFNSVSSAIDKLIEMIEKY